MPSEVEQYASWVGLAYVFNLIVGTGALTLPFGFQSAGWLLSIFLITLLCFVSFISITFVIESIACANAYLKWKNIQFHRSEEIEDVNESGSEGDYNEETAIIGFVRIRKRDYSLDTKVELCEISDLFLGKIVRGFFYSILCIYLLGDLTIYAAAVSKTLVDLSCDTSNDTYFNVEKCWENLELVKTDIYRIYVAVFAVLLGPFCYFNVQKTKYFQIFTLVMRWTAFFVMVFLAFVRITKGARGHPSAFDVAGVPTLIGSSIYSFMCHHSIPNLVAPFSNKQNMSAKLGVDMVLICAFYLILSLTGVFAFEKLQDLYTLNFIPEHVDDSGFFMNVIYYFLGAFPLFTLSMSFPIISITLQNNLKALMFDRSAIENYNVVVRRLMFPTISVLPPILIALTTHNLKALVEVTGSYPGVFVQYIFPTVLVLVARKKCKRSFGTIENKFASPFQSDFWIVFVLSWSVVCIVFETYNFFTKYT